jgi:hypothetical protein
VTPGTLDDQYLTWLYGQVAAVRARKSSRTFWDLFRQLFETEFAWVIANDENRAADGRELRREWVDETRSEVDLNWLALGCSFLEMLIGLSRRLAFGTDGDAANWFWHLINNLGLQSFHDRSGFSSEDVEDITSAVIWRTYEPDGTGGLFPIRDSGNDQREVEIWYQLSEYLLQEF